MGILVLALHLPLAAAEPKLFRHPESVPNQYFVGLEERAPAALEHLAHSLAASYGGAVVETFPAALGGFLIDIPSDKAERLADDPRVKFVEENAFTELSLPRVSAGATPGTADGTYLWYLDRIDQAYPDGSGNLDNKYYYCNTGAGVVTYILDEGVDGTHPELVGRVALQHDFVGKIPNRSNPCATNYKGWHGTAVAGVLGGKYAGVANGSTMVALNVVDCEGGGSLLPLVAALNWIIAEPNQAPSYSTFPPNPYISPDHAGVINLSGWVLRGSKATDGTWVSPTIETVFINVSKKGHTIVTSADNFTWDSCSVAPNILAEGRPYYPRGYVITVGGTMLEPGGVQKRWNEPGQSGWDMGSNSGNCISIWAPARNIYAAMHSAYYTKYRVRYKYWSGTSFSAPIISGMAARYMQRFKGINGRFPTQWEVYSFLDLNSVKYKAGSTTTPLIQETATPSWTGYDPVNKSDTYVHPSVDTWRIVGMSYWGESCRVRPVRL